MAIDPVCGMDIDEKSTEYKLEYMGKNLLLLLSSMYEKFLKNLLDTCLQQRIAKLTGNTYMKRLHLENIQVRTNTKTTTTTMQDITR